MKHETIIEVTEKLIGAVEPVGETHTDDKRFENLKALIEVADSLLRQLSQVAKYADRYEYSMNRAGKTARAFLTAIPEEY